MEMELEDREKEIAEMLKEVKYLREKDLMAQEKIRNLEFNLEEL